MVDSENIEERTVECEISKKNIVIGIKRDGVLEYVSTVHCPYFFGVLDRDECHLLNGDYCYVQKYV